MLGNLSLKIAEMILEVKAQFSISFHRINQEIIEIALCVTHKRDRWIMRGFEQNLTFDEFPIGGIPIAFHFTGPLVPKILFLIAKP